MPKWCRKIRILCFEYGWGDVSCFLFCVSMIVILFKPGNDSSSPQYSHPMSFHQNSRRVCFTRPVIHSSSRKPTRLELLYMNLFEHHVERCRLCEPLKFGLVPFHCRRGRVLEGFILESFSMNTRGKVFSVLEEWGRPVQVEIANGYCTVLALLREIDRPRHMHGSLSRGPSILRTR